MGGILGSEEATADHREHAEQFENLPKMQQSELFQFTKCTSLIIGNNKYCGVTHGKLHCCEDDAERVAKALRAGQFPDAQPLKNLNRRDMFNWVESLSRSESDFTWFHFSGHGVLYKEEVYLVPVDSERNEDNIPLSYILDSVRKIAKEGLHIFTLDMCQQHSSQRGPQTMEAIERILDMATEPTAGTRGRFEAMSSRIQGLHGLPDPGRYKFNHEIWIYTSGEIGYTVTDNGFFSTAIAEFAELFDRGPQDMIDIVTDKVWVKSGKTQKPGHRHEHRRTDCRYIITKRSGGSHQAGLADPEQAALAADMAALAPARFADVRRIVEAEAARRSKQPGEYSGGGWTPDWSLQSVLTEDKHSKANRAAKCLIVLDGLIGCGKTTFLRRFKKNGSENVQFVAEPVSRNEPDTWWSDLEALYRVMQAGTQEEKITATFKLECKVCEHHFRVATQRQMHTFTERGLGSTVRVFCKVCKENGLLTEGQYEYFLKAYEKYSSDESLRPTLTLHFKLPIEVALGRINERADKEDREFEKDMPRPYLEQLESAYKEFLRNQEDVIVVESNNPVEDMMVDIAGPVEEKLRRRGVAEQDLRSVMRCFEAD